MTAIQTNNLAEYIVVEFRWLLVVTLLLPLSFFWNLWSHVRNYVVFRLNSAPKAHEKKVKDVQRQVKQWLANGRTSHMCTARPAWQAMSFRRGIYKETFTNIHVDLVDVLEVDAQNLTVRCEPLVTLGLLSKTLKSLGLALAVVPELDQLTIGGLVMGTGIETTSHVYGLIQHICLEYELVLADGSVVTCNKDQNTDLFYAVPWSYGTLGFLTAVTMKVVPAKKYVRMEYLPFTNAKDLCARFKEETLKKNTRQFIEGLMYSKDTGVVMLGDMVDEVGDDGKENPIGKWYAEWFYVQVEKQLKRYQRGEEKIHVDYIPLRDYYHRHTRSIFWELKDIVPFGNNVLFRYLLGWMMPPDVALLKLTQTKTIADLYERAHVIQDMLVPIDVMEKALEVVHKEFEVYPTWLCAFKLFNRPGMLKMSSTAESQMFLDIGLYGVPAAKGYETIPSTRRVEKFVMDHQGFQMLYADTYTTHDEFRTMFDHTLYDKVRAALPYCKDAFPEVYGKVNRNVRK